MAGVEDIIGRTSHNSLKNRFEHFNIKFLKPLLLKEKPRTRETSILTVLSRLNIRDAMHHITSHGTFLGPLVVSDPALSSDGGGGVANTKRGSSVSLDEHEVYFSPPATVVDIHSVEAVYSRKDLDDTRMHHMLEDAMFRPRKTFVMEKKHTVVDDEPHAQVSHHHAYQQLRRLISLEVQRQHLHQYHPDSDVSPAKVLTLSTYDSAVTTDETKIPPTEKPLEDKEGVKLKDNDKEEETEGAGVKFTLGAHTLGAPADSKFTSLDSGLSGSDEDVSASPPPEETEAERVLPWKRTTQLPPVRSSLSLSMPDDDHPLMSQAPSWADNLAYNHLTESGSPYVSPENTIGAPAASASRRPVFDIFPLMTDATSPPTDACSPQDKVDCAQDPLPPPWASQSSLPPPWASDSSEEPPLTSPEAHDGGGGEKLTTYLQSSSHNFYPPSHHNCLVSQEGGAEALPPPSGASVGLRPANSPKHFQPIQMTEMCSRHCIEEEIIADEADYQERLVSRVQSWLDSSEPSDEEHDFEDLNATVEEHDDNPHDDSIDDIDIDDLHIDTYL